MDRYGICGKILAKEGQRAALIEILVEASQTPMRGCEFYIVCKSPTEANAIWVMEVWQSETDHEASFKLDCVKALITKAWPVMASAAESIRMIPVGGKALAPA
jgi:quinol monooxygenase YgiN